MTISLSLYDPLLYGNAPLGDYTLIFAPTWRRTIRRRGGFFVGTVNLTENELTQPEMEEFFRYGLMREIREVGGGAESWRGACMKMEYTKRGQLFTTDITRFSNAAKVIYTRIFDDLLLNGSAESSAWTSYNSGTTAQSTAWKADGTYSCLITAAAATQGARINGAGYTIPIAANAAYTIDGRLNLVSGSWRCSVNRADNGQALCHFSTHGGNPGDYTVNMTIPATNTYAGMVDLSITAESGGTTQIYGDAFTFKEAPIPNVSTGWYEDTQSIAIWGRKEEAILEVGKTTEAANAEAQTYLNRWGWPTPFPPNNYTALAMGAADPGATLRLTFAGYWATLNWLTVPTTVDHGTISGLITTLVGMQSSYIASSDIEVNNTPYVIDNRGTLYAGDVIKDMTGDGASGGALYGAGVYAYRIFDYHSIPAELTYHLRGGDLYGASDSLYEPWLARPGYALWQDLPIGPTTLANPNNDPRWVFLEEIEMLPGSTVGEQKLAYNLEPQ